MEESNNIESLDEICPFLGKKCLGYSYVVTCPFWDDSCLIAGAFRVIAEDSIGIKTYGDEAVCVTTDPFDRCGGFGIDINGVVDVSV